MKTLAFDQAMAISGYAVYSDNRLAKHGTIETNKKKEKDERTAEMMNALIDMIKAISPDKVVIEGVALQTNVAVVVLLARIQGAVMGYCYEHNIKVEIIMPATWRKALGFEQGKKDRKNLKAQAKAYALECFQCEVSEDESDAICIGYASIIR